MKPPRKPAPRPRGPASQQSAGEAQQAIAQQNVGRDVINVFLGRPERARRSRSKSGPRLAPAAAPPASTSQKPIAAPPPPATLPPRFNGFVINYDLTDSTGRQVKLRSLLPDPLVADQAMRDWHRRLLAKAVEEAQVPPAVLDCAQDHGDGFCLPVEKAEQAHRFTVAVHDECRRTNLERAPHDALLYRFGVASGQVSVSADGKSFDSTCADLAARLRAASAPGGTVICAETWRALPSELAKEYVSVPRTIPDAKQPARTYHGHDWRLGHPAPPTSPRGPGYQAFLNRRIALQSRPEAELDRQFIKLTLLLNPGEQAQGPRWQETGEFEDLAELLDQTAQHPAVVILGAPGSGKSTLLRHHELETARAALAGGPPADTARLPFYVELNRFKPDPPGASLPKPMDWLAEQWRQDAEGLPALPDLLKQGRLVFLLDGLNEAGGDKQTVVSLWGDFLRELRKHSPGNRVVFSCRSLDYSASLSYDQERTAPQARLKELTPGQMEAFLVKYAPGYGSKLWAKLDGTEQVEAFRTPYFLRLLVEGCPDGNIPAGRASLFTKVVRRALHRELRKALHPDAGLDCLPPLQGSPLLTEGDRRQIDQGAWTSPAELPERGRLIPALAHLTFQMQLANREATQPATESGPQVWPKSAEESKPHVRISEAEALRLIRAPCPDACLKAGVALGLLTVDIKGKGDEVLFYHQLLQEYFAARQFAAQPRPDLVRQEWKAAQVRPSLEEKLATLGDNDPLPPPDTSGWEETNVLAAGMAADPAAFVRGLMVANLPLAGRAAAQPETVLPEALTNELRQALLARSRDEQADLRARIAAGLALGEVGDPRFERGEGQHGEYLLPPFVTIPAGSYPIGSNEGQEDEKPIHRVKLAKFAIAQFPVTNAEW